jgi:hypothetical protein
MEGTGGADVLSKQYNVIRMVSMICFEGTVASTIGFRPPH